MRTTSSLPLLLFWIASAFAQQATAPDTGTESVSNEPSVSFLIPADGDVIYTLDLKVLARIENADPSDLLPVIDGFSGGATLQLDKDIVTLNLSGLSQGVHEIRMLYVDSGRVVSTPAVHFFVRIPEPKPDTVISPWSRSGHVTARMEYRGRSAASRIVRQSQLRGIEVITVPETDSTWPYDSTALIVGKGERPFSKNLSAGTEVTYKVKNGRWEGGFNGLLSTDENRFRQPANRVSADVSYGPWAYVRGGDVYPNYNPLILNGARLRGGEAGAALVTGDSETHWAYVKVASGETQREVPAYVLESENGTGGYRLDYVPGSYPQELSTVRVGIGGGESFDLGITVMKTKERPQDSAFEAMDEYLYGPRPLENLVTGIDSRLGLWEGRVQLYGQWAVSLFTRDRSLGAFTLDTSAAGAFDPGDYRDLVIINPTTRGWQYLLTDSVRSKPDTKRFVDASSTYLTGVSSSIPFAKVVWETDASYSHTGAEYHSEGNPSLDGNPADGWDLQQRFGLLEDRLHLGAEASNFVQDLIDYKQVARTFKADVRVSPGAYRPTYWANASTTTQSPRGDAPYRYRQDYDEMNLGGLIKRVVGPGILNFTTQYGYSYSKLTIRPADSAPAPQSYPAVKTHNVSTAVQYKIRGTDLQPKISHTYSDNGVQKPTNNAVLGVQDAFFSKRLTADFNFLMGQYPKTKTRNDLSFGQNASATLKIKTTQTLRGYEKWSKYGNRISIISGANYEMFF